MTPKIIPQLGTRASARISFSKTSAHKDPLLSAEPLFMPNLLFCASAARCIAGLCIAGLGAWRRPSLELAGRLYEISCANRTKSGIYRLRIYDGGATWGAQKHSNAEETKKNTAAMGPRTFVVVSPSYAPFPPPQVGHKSGCKTQEMLESSFASWARLRTSPGSTHTAVVVAVFAVPSLHPITDPEAAGHPHLS